MIEITTESVVKGLDALVAQEGEDFIYRKNAGACTYIKNDAGDCIVGRYLVAQGVPVERLKEADGTLSGVRAPALLRALKEEGVLDYEERAVAILDVAQDLQDTGETWGEAVSYAKNSTR